LATDEDLILQAHHALETSLFWSGRFAEALEHMRSGLAIYDLDRHRLHAAMYGGHDPGICCLAFQSLAMWICGYFDQAARSCADAISLGRQLEHPGSAAHAQQLVCRLDLLKRDARAVAPTAESLFEIATMHGFPHPLAVAQIAQGWAMAKQGQLEAGIARVQEGIAVHDRTGARLGRSLDYSMLAELLNQSGQTDSANQCLDMAFAHSSDSNERFHEAELWRLRGQFLLVQDRPQADEAEVCFKKALAVAQTQGARAWELRACTSLARLWRDQARRAEAHDLLAPVYGWFTEGFDTADLKDAKALLDDLA
jgi:predicted ATPase